MIQAFDTFREASQFAARFCLEHHTTASVKKIDGRWAVVPSDEFQAEEARQAQKRELAEKKRIAEQLATAEAIQRAERAQKLLEERRAYFSALSKDALQVLWDNRERPLSTQEFDIIRALLRQALGIKSIAPVNLAICSKCFLVGDACTCH